MQSKFFTLAVAALSLSSVQSAAVPGAVIISPGVIVLPQITFNPNSLQFQQTVFQTLDLLRADIAKTAALVNQLTNTTAGNVLGTINQASVVLGQATTNVANILTKVTGLTNVIKGLFPPGAPPAPPADIPDIGGAAEDVVRQAQVLARAITTQLEALRKQATGFAGLLLIPTLATTQIGLQAVLATVGTVSSLALTTAASATSNVQAILDRVRNAQVKLNPVLIIGIQPDIVF
ncbi:hypothetical protein CI238_05293 [Colletotrichum incanum]|uniref:Uncharacterized protein n=1 Tax=Colletotrichum incanum TaxID=1573173 RepID=A0A162NBS8_COLIC|nr:hypothetical protein CI238_05293 [Colletotrichum incanum]OHX00957.1 hypothetical protein CSPAE12_00311 [Colletotrichum incanum]